MPGFDRTKANLPQERNQERPLALPSAAMVSLRQNTRISRPPRKHIRLYGQSTEEGFPGSAGAGNNLSLTLTGMSSLVEQGGKALLSSLGGLLAGSD
jgi:hypothetical protein